MTKLKDFIAAKRALSSRLLRGRRIARAAAPERTVAAASRNARHTLFGVGVGYKVANGKMTRTPCVRLYVVQKLPESLIARSARLPKSIAGLPTDVIESPIPIAHSCSSDRMRRQRPIVGGISAAHHQVALSCTLGCFCHSASGETNRLFMLSNNHAFADLNRAPLGSPILQQSRGDGGNPLTSRAGTLYRFVPIVFGGTRPNRVDAAIARVSASRTETVCSIGALTGVRQATLGMEVRKHGRTTGLTRGRVVDVDVDMVGNFYGPSMGLVLFENQIRIDPIPPYPVFAGPGDSGSVVVHVSGRFRRVVGLHFSGAFGSSYANPIRDVCNELRIRIP